MTSIMLSLHPDYVHLILAGTKTIEIRSRSITPAKDAPVTAYLYATSPIGGVLGECRLSEAVLPDGYDWPDSVLQAAHITRAELHKYGGDHPHAFDLDHPISYGYCRSVASYGLTRPPQSWCGINEQEVD